MVDSVRYLRHGSGDTDPNSVWRCFLNKASYALRTSREFYESCVEEAFSSNASCLVELSLNWSSKAMIEGVRR